MKITLKQKTLKDGSISLYIEYYKGSSTDVNGKKIHLRDFEYLKLYLLSNPKDKIEKQKNKEALELAENILSIRKAEYLQGKYDIKNTAKAKRTFLNYFSELAEEKQKKNSLNNYNCWYSTLQHLKKIVSANFTFDEIDENFVKKVRNYFDNKAITKSSLPLSQN